MRRVGWVAGAAGAVVAVAVAALVFWPGPGGSDGDLTDDWAALSAPQSVTPKAGECHADLDEQVSATVAPVDCAAEHVAETVYVGRFEGTVTQAADAPLLRENATGADAEAQSRAYAECSDRATAYLGHPWFDVRLDLDVTLPTAAAWQAGLRWFRCDLVQTGWGLADPVARKGSLKDAWLPTACADLSGADWPQVDCAKKHDGEYAGAFLAPAAAKKPAGKAMDPLHDKCFDLIAPYLGVSRAKVDYTVGDALWFADDFAYWSSGRRTVHCFIWLDKQTTTGSLKGRGKV
ncbi:septum formation family protein [Hamadaea tsunoensis]|uniref:septum formation family protein n=1 Tax=Hamadaea tsunoensis TaxID=53368 RepID=UPI000402950B|nr:septum formation family protein [Hamadaea tsunoensis]